MTTAFVFSYRQSLNKKWLVGWLVKLNYYVKTKQQFLKVFEKHLVYLS